MKKKAAKQQWPKVKETAHKSGSTAWQVDARISGRGERLYFQTKTEADTKADQLRVERLNHGTAGVAIPDKLRREAVDAAARLAAVGVTITEAVDYYFRHARPSAGKCAVTTLVDEFLESKESNDRRPEYLRVQRCVLGKFARSFGETNVHEIDAGQLEEWLANPEWQPRTRLNYWRDLSNLFGFAIRKKYCAANPVLAIDKPDPGETVPGILTPVQAAALLTGAEFGDAKILPFIALGLFAGLRTAELMRLDWSNIDFEDRDVTVDAAAAKTGQVRYVPMSDNLVEWLLPYRKDKGPIRPPAWRWHFEAARKRAGITPWVDNAMRHSFGSYHFALHNDAPRTAAALGHHSSTATLFKHYRKLAKKKHAETYFSLSPSAAGKIVSIAA